MSTDLLMSVIGRSGQVQGILLDGVDLTAAGLAVPLS